jgi:hypothetical protein
MNCFFWAGMRIKAPFPLPDLSPSESWSEPDIVIRIGAVHIDHLELVAIDQRQWLGQRAYLLRRDGVATYLVEDGNQITIAPHDGASQAEIVAFLAGRPFAALAYQRRWLSIHGGAVLGRRGVVVFAAPGGTGKSTLLSALDLAGHQLLSDDAAIVRESHDPLLVWPTSQRFRLHPDSVSCLGLNIRAGASVREGFAKIAIPFRRPVKQPAKLDSIFLLRRAGDRVKIKPLSLVEAVSGVTSNINRPALAELIRGKSSLLEHVARVVQNVPVFQLTIPDQLDRLNDVCALLETHDIVPQHSSIAARIPPIGCKDR